MVNFILITYTDNKGAPYAVLPPIAGSHYPSLDDKELNAELLKYVNSITTNAITHLDIIGYLNLDIGEQIMFEQEED